MSSSFQEIPITKAQRNISIADIAIFSIPLVVRIAHIIRLSVVGHLDGPLPRRLLLDRIVIFCLVRIVGSALYLAATSPTDSILIGALILESLGTTFFMFELIRLLVVYLKHSGTSSKPQQRLQRAVQLLRIPILIGIILLIVGYNVSDAKVYKILSRTGSLVFLATFFAIASIYAYMGVCLRHVVGVARTSFLLAVFALPFLSVRMLYVVLSAFRVDHGAFLIIWGDWRIFVAMGLTMEVFIVGLLVVSGLAEPPVLSRTADTEGDMELGVKGPRTV